MNRVPFVSDVYCSSHRTKMKVLTSLSGFIWGSASKPPSFFGPWHYTVKVTMLCSSLSCIPCEWCPSKLWHMVVLSWAWTPLHIFYPVVIFKKKNLHVFKKVWHYLCHNIKLAFWIESVWFSDHNSSCSFNGKTHLLKTWVSCNISAILFWFLY